MMFCILDIEPKACPRPRVANRRAYYPKTYTDWKNHAAGLMPFFVHAPKNLEIRFIFKRPKRLKKGPRQPHDKRPDLDNLLKAVFDLFDFDDGAISSISSSKWYAASGENEHILLYWEE